VAGAKALGVSDSHLHLQLWHGLTVALGLSAVILAAGLGLFRVRLSVERLQQRRWLPVAGDLYRETVRLLNVGADRLTGIVQNGSLPVYLGVILVCFVALPISGLVTGTVPTPELELAESPLHALVVVLVGAAAIATASLTRRFAAVLALGTVGFGVAVLFMIQGAPDLALTQLLIETLVVIIFLLVLWHLPERFEPVGWILGQGFRVIVSVAVGGFVAVLAALAAASRTATPISEEMAARSLPDAAGRNIVNVILVDFRGLDTLGEITVLAVAALGITSLVLAGRRAAGRAEPPISDGGEGVPVTGADGAEVSA
jgi:multicomponent Na+:H+ antiporter subunit A